jgi:predicted nucleic acid-binding protein
MLTIDASVWVNADSPNEINHQSSRNLLSALPFITWISLDDRLARVAFSLAAQHALRGADAVYAAVAREHSCDLISLDDQHLTRLAGVVPTFTPAQALSRLAR